MGGIAFAGFRLAYQMSAQTQEPDLAAFVRSRAVQAADHAAAGWLDRQSRRLAARASGLTLAGHAVSDVCGATAGVDGLFDQGLRSAVYCHRTDSWYFAARRHRQAEIRDLEKVLSRSGGWGRFASVPAGRAAHPVLPVTTGSLTGRVGRDRPPGGRAGLSLIWVSRKDQLPAAALGAHSRVTGDRIRYLHVLPPDLDAVARRSFGAHRRVLVVVFDDSYFTGSGLAPSPGRHRAAARTRPPPWLAALRGRDGRPASVD